MSHLGERLTALIDGELGHDEREKALGHLTACDQCRAEADTLRGLKRRLRALSDTVPAESLIQRLQAMGEPGGPVLPPVPRMPGHERRPAVTRPRDTRPDNRPPGAAVRRRRPRARYLMAGAAALAVFGIGSAAFAAGSEPQSLPRVSPSVEQFAVEHALTSGDVPLTDPRPATDKISDSP
jgi:anti-sigma factor RsiW